MMTKGDIFAAVFVVVTIGMIVAGPLLAFWFDNGNWLWLMVPIILYLP